MLLGKQKRMISSMDNCRISLTLMLEQAEDKFQADKSKE